MTDARLRRPSQVNDELPAFDRFAGAASAAASRAPFFAFRVALIVVWASRIALLKLDTWQLPDAR